MSAPVSANPFIGRVPLAPPVAAEDNASRFCPECDADLDGNDPHAPGCPADPNPATEASADARPPRRHDLRAEVIRPAECSACAELAAHAQRTNDMDELTQELVASVREYARNNYHRNGWDFVVEAWDDEEIAEEIGKARNPDAAILNVAHTVLMLDEHRREIKEIA